MSAAGERLQRSIVFFGEKGQRQLRDAQVGVVGIGGIGTHVLQQLALLRVGGFVLVDPEDLEESNLNRYVGARHDDPIPGTPKVELGKRIVRTIAPSIPIVKVRASFLSEHAMAALKSVTHLFGCVDREGLRLILTEFSAAYSIPYIDVATEILPGPPLEYGGRVCVAWDGNGCAVCLGILDQREVQIDLASEATRRDQRASYGVPRTVLGHSGPSVVCINGVLTSLAVTEFMLAVTGIRRPERLLTYRGHLHGVVTTSRDQPVAGCYYCTALRGQGDAADLLRYVRGGVQL